MLKQLFLSLISQYTNEADLQQKLWMDIEKHYTGKKRHYHNLSHLENLITELKEVKELINNWDALLFFIMT